mgnify:CR=1 FL=1
MHRSDGQGEYESVRNLKDLQVPRAKLDGLENIGADASLRRSSDRDNSEAVSAAY